MKKIYFLLVAALVLFGLFAGNTKEVEASVKKDALKAYRKILSDINIINGIL